MKQAPPVKSEKEIIPGNHYYLSELPDGILFLYNKGKFKTITYPQFNIMNYKQVSRPCYNMKTKKTENLKYGTRVKIIN